MLSEIEAALDTGRLFIVMANGARWQARRNGKTKLWVTRPEEFSIPFKVGLRTCGRIDHNWKPEHYEIR